jgi:two-component system, chemotaxis family, protein-glutamate methylesterase/glutaminase
MARIRVLVVEDSLTVRKRLVEVLQADPEFLVVGEAADGKRGFELCRELRPDVVTLDMMLPVMTGLAATEQIMAHAPTPILIVSASTNRGELFRTYDALAAGAVDVLDKPLADASDGDWEHRFLAALKLVAKIKVITHPRASLGWMGRGATVVPVRSRSRPAPHSVVAIGASTGGPQAVVQVLRALPCPFPLPILLVVHIGDPFAAAFAEWLDGQSGHRAAAAVEGERLAALAGRVVLAPPGCHLEIVSGRTHLSTAPERNSCRPSVDVLFESVAREIGSLTAACLMTGMGRDGAEGLLAIRRAGGFTIAQDEATSTIYGMPREAVRLGAAQRMVPLGEIAATLAEAAGIEAGPESAR